MAEAARRENEEKRERGFFFFKGREGVTRGMCTRRAGNIKCEDVGVGE